MKLTKLFLAAVIVLTANASFAQDTNEASHTVTINIEEVALLDLEATAGTAIILKGTAPTEAGEAVTFGDDATNATIWINYSSIVGSTTEPARNVSVQITDGAVPAGLKLTALASADAGNGAGTMGEASAVLTLTVDSQDIITGVGSAYTGDGATNGHKLTYQLGYATDAATDYGSLDFDNSDVLTITYTLSDI